jgi:hypothetical protein
MALCVGKGHGSERMGISVHRPVRYDWLFSFKVQMNSKVGEDSRMIHLKKFYFNNKK